MEDRAARLRGTITFLIVCVLAVGGLLIYFINRPAEPVQVVTVAPAPAPAPAPPAPPKIRWIGYVTLAPKGQDGYLSPFYDYDGPGKPIIAPDTSGIKLGGCGYKSGGGYTRVPCNEKDDEAFYIENITDQPVRKRVGVAPYDTPATPGTPSYVWDGTWRHLHIPAGIGSMSATVPVPPDTEVYLPAGVPYKIECMTGNDSEGYTPLPVGNHCPFFRLLNKNEEEQDAEWHPGPIVN